MIRTATTVSHTVIMTTMSVNIPLVLLAEYEAGGTDSKQPPISVVMLIQRSNRLKVTGYDKHEVGNIASFSGACYRCSIDIDSLRSKERYICGKSMKRPCFHSLFSY
jgi:hypothetical protein